MNIYRFFVLPNALKPAILILIILTMIIAAATDVKPGQAATGSWFFWITMVVQLVFMSGVVVAFLFEMELLLTFGQDKWPVVEMGYSTIFGIMDVINMFLAANWNTVSSSRAFIACALIVFAIVILYGLGLVMMFRIWRGGVSSGSTQNPVGNVQPGDAGNMHRGI